MAFRLCATAHRATCAASGLWSPHLPAHPSDLQRHLRHGAAVSGLERRLSPVLTQPVGPTRLIRSHLRYAVPVVKIRCFDAGEAREIPVKVVRNLYWRKAGPDLRLQPVVVKPLGYRLQRLQAALSPACLSHLHRSGTGPADTGAGLRGSLGDRVPSSRRKVIHRCGARPGLEPPSRHPPAPISGSHLQLAAVGFHGLWVSAHGRLSTPAVMETKVDSPFDLGSAESAARPNLRSPDAGSAHAEYRRLRGVGARRRERRETATGFGDALHHSGLTILPGYALSRIWPISRVGVRHCFARHCPGWAGREARPTTSPVPPPGTAARGSRTTTGTSRPSAYRAFFRKCSRNPCKKPPPRIEAVSRADGRRNRWWP